MITTEKIDIYRALRGYYDGYYTQNRDVFRKVSDDEWDLIASFMEDLFLIRKGLASTTFEVSVTKKIKENCDSLQTVQLLKELEIAINFGK